MLTIAILSCAPLTGIGVCDLRIAITTGSVVNCMIYFERRGKEGALSRKETKEE